MDVEAAVLEFMRANGLAVGRMVIGTVPVEVTVAAHNAYVEARSTSIARGRADVACLRARLVAEEAYELIEALRGGDLADLADACADLVYVAVGTAIAAGIPFDAVFREVHRSNMTKKALDGEAKGGKTPGGYSPPDIARVLKEERA